MKFLFFTLASFSKFPSYKRSVGMGQALALMGHDVFIAARDCEENRQRLKQEAPDCNPVWVDAQNPFREAWQKLRAVYRLRPDVVYSPSFSIRNLAYCGFLLPRETKRVIEFCELYSVYLYSRPSLFWKINEKIACVENTHVLCASKSLESHFSEKMGEWNLKRPICYLPYAYPSYLTKPLKSVHGRRRILLMASLWRGYGVYDVLEAFCMVRGKSKEIELDILGNGPERESVIEWISRHGLSDVIHIHGFVSEDRLNEYFSSADVFVSPMHDTVQDRMRCPSKLYYYIPYGKPIVTCRIGDPYDTLGDYGFYYKPTDVADMAKAMQEGLDRCDSFRFPDGFIERHSWFARAMSFLRWIADKTA